MRLAGDNRRQEVNLRLCVSFGDAAISWKSSKQTCVVLSTAEAEYHILG